MGYRDLWTLEAILNDTQPATGQVAASYHQPNRRPPLSIRRGTCSLESCITSILREFEDPEV
jgi:hypothetical protein